MSKNQTQPKAVSAEQPRDEGLSSGDLFCQVNAILARHGMELTDRADGCKGHYCIRRFIPGTNKKYVEHWSENKGGHWNSFGTLYTDARQALGQAMLIVERQNGQGLRPVTPERSEQ